MRSGRASYALGAVVLAGELMAVALALKVLGWALVVGPVLTRWYVVAGFAILALVLAAMLSAKRWVRAIGVVATVPIWLLGGLTVLALLVIGGVPLPVQRVPAPESPPYELVVRESRDWIDPIYDLSVETAGPIGISWSAGCVNGDYQGLDDVRWTSAGELVVTIDSGDEPDVATVIVDPATGRVVGSLSPALRRC